MGKEKKKVFIRDKNKNWIFVQGDRLYLSWMFLDTKFILNYEGKHNEIHLASNYHKGFKIGKEQNILFQINLHGNENSKSILSFTVGQK